MTSELNDLLNGYMRDVWNNGDLSAMGHYLSDDFVCHDPHEPLITGLGEAAAFVKKMSTGIVNSQIRIEDTIEEGDFIACRLRVAGEHGGKLLGLEPTNCQVVMPVMCLWRAENGRFRELWQHLDAHGVQRQIDAARGGAALANDLVFDPQPSPATLTGVSEAEVQKNKDTVRRWMDGAWNHNRFDLVDECFAQDMWFWDPFGPVISGREGFRDWAKQINVAFPERELGIDHVIGEGNKIAYRVTLRAKHGGNFLGVEPTNNDIEASAMVMSVHENGCYKTAHQIFDVLKVLQDIGHA